MFELHGAKTGNCLRVSLALEVCAIPYRVVHVDLGRGAHREPAHLALNPAGKVPTLVARSAAGAPFVLSQSNAILFHLSDLAPGLLLPSGGEQLRAGVYERFFYFLTDVIAPSHAAFQLRAVAAAESREVLERRSIDSLMAAERFLTGGVFMAGASFSLADIAAYTITKSLEARIEWSRVPRLREWFVNLDLDPRIQRGMRAFDLPSP